MEYILILATSLAIGIIFSLIFVEVHITTVNKRIEDLLKDVHPEANENNVSDLDVYREKRKQEMIDHLCKFRLEYDPSTHTYTKVETLRDDEVDIIT